VNFFGGQRNRERHIGYETKNEAMATVSTHDPDQATYTYLLRWQDYITWPESIAKLQLWKIKMSKITKKIKIHVVEN